MTGGTIREAPPIDELDAQLAARPLEQVIHRARYLHGEPGPMDSTDEAYATRIAKAVRKWLEVQPATPIPMVLHCPSCGSQHIDEPTEDWPNPPHRSHLCGTCGCIWRPADVPTVGVAAIATASTSDNWESGEVRAPPMRDEGDLLLGGLVERQAVIDMVGSFAGSQNLIAAIRRIPYAQG